VRGRLLTVGRGSARQPGRRRPLLRSAGKPGGAERRREIGAPLPAAHERARGNRAAPQTASHSWQSVRGRSRDHTRRSASRARRRSRPGSCGWAGAHQRAASRACAARRRPRRPAAPRPCARTRPAHGTGRARRTRPDPRPARGRRPARAPARARRAPHTPTPGCSGPAGGGGVSASPHAVPATHMALCLSSIICSQMMWSMTGGHGCAEAQRSPSLTCLVQRTATARGSTPRLLGVPGQQAAPRLAQILNLQPDRARVLQATGVRERRPQQRCAPSA